MRTALALVGVLALGCGGGTAAIPVAGPASDVARLVGDWAGTFEADDGASGTVHFHLGAVGDTAWGDLQMLPDPVRPGPEAPGPTRMEPPVVLTIRFVQVAEYRVRGMLEPYRDPRCGCRVTAVFEGTVRGDVIGGEFLTRHLDHPREVRGTWQVTRLIRRD